MCWKKGALSWSSCLFQSPYRTVLRETAIPTIFDLTSHLNNPHSRHRKRIKELVLELSDATPFLTRPVKYVPSGDYDSLCFLLHRQKKIFEELKREDVSASITDITLLLQMF